jgi:bifunctional DNA-binding transcriptional regulator/antitoxin component of YhaV-PrlF toxin-antitoxin module
MIYSDCLLRFLVKKGKEGSAMLTATLSKNGALPLPDVLLRRLSLTPGDTVEFVLGRTAGQAVLKTHPERPGSLFGSLSAYRPENPVTDGDMRETVMEHAAARSAPR